MDSFEFSEAKAPRRKKSTTSMIWNSLTILMLVIAAGVAVVFFLIYIDPYSNLNPFPPPTDNPALAPATPSIAPRMTLVPSWTPTQETIRTTDTPGPSHTPLYTSSVVEEPTLAVPATTQDPGDFAFVVQPGSPSAIEGSQFYPEAGCQWMGVGGQVVSLNGESVGGLFVELGGSLPGIGEVNNISMTGLAPQYGVGGFEITLANELVASENTLWVQLMDQQNLPLSGKVYFSTFADCEKNLVIIYFEQVH